MFKGQVFLFLFGQLHIFRSRYFLPGLRQIKNELHSSWAADSASIKKSCTDRHGKKINHQKGLKY